MECVRKAFPVNGIRICVDEYDEQDLSGRIYSKLLPHPLFFRNCGELLLKADSMFDETGYPQAFQCKRTFSEGKALGNYCVRPVLFLSDSDIFHQEGKRSTFDVIVRTRQHAGWQGCIRSVSDNEEMKEFRSELEMLRKLILDQIETGRQPQNKRR